MLWFIKEFLENGSNVLISIFFKAKSPSLNEMMEMFWICSAQHCSHQVGVATEHLNAASATKK